MLRDGEIDAFHTARMPSSYDGVNVKRLFVDYPSVELDYFRKTKIFPIMHTVAIRREVYEANRWIAQSLYKAFAAAKQKAYAELTETAALKTMVPWLTHHVEETRREMGEDFWSYGLEPNYALLETFLGYHHDCGLSKRRLKPEELFAPETLEAFKI
jgi:4,5-dihydroxyphthalate decarboxylase